MSDQLQPETKPVLKAFAVIWQDYPQLAPIFAAETADKAKYLAYLHARDVYRTTQITEFRARRAPEHDAFVQEHITRPGTVFRVDVDPFSTDDGTGRRIV